MRVWDQIEPSRLCRNHLLAEHRETLAIWSILTNNKKGYQSHPEVLRWKNHLNALVYRHALLQMEAFRRGYEFKNLPDSFIHYSITMPEPWDNQIETLKSKGCECLV
jgi:hypothetical protein